jgi:putative ABC transport system permease protein
MFQNYLRTAFRSIRREGYYAVIKVAGLSLGLGTSLVLLLYVLFQMSFDNFHHDLDRLYRVNQTSIWEPGGGIFHSTGPAVAFALAEEFPEIEGVLRINTPGGYTIRYHRPDGTVAAFNESFSNVFAADSNFFEFFNFELQAGDPAIALRGKNKVVLSDAAAKKLFGDQSPIGKLIEFGEEGVHAADGSEPFSHDHHLVEVTGVTKPQPPNSHFHFDYLLSMYTNPNIKQFEWSWIWTQVATYVKLRPGTDVEAIREKLKTFADRHAPATFKRVGIDYQEFKDEKGGWELYLQPVRDIHLYSAARDGMGAIGNRLGPVGDIREVYVLSLVALFILLIAVINFINLSTARGSTRAKEVGVKKTLGMRRGSLIAQFQVEHIVLTMMAMLLGLGVMELLRIAIQPMVGIHIPLGVVKPLPFIALVSCLGLVVGFLAGLYPSLYLTSFRPAAVLKGKIALGFRSSGLRNWLVVFQFAISIALMAVTLIIFSQLEYFRNQDLGLSVDNVLIVDHAEKLGEQLESFRDEIRQLPGVVSASMSMDIQGGYQDIFTRERDDRKLTLDTYKIDEYLFETLSLSLAAGRTFDPARSGDQNGVLINEVAEAQLGWTPEEAIGERLIYIGDDVGPQEIIGVVRDFHFQSLRQSIAPLVLFHTSSRIWGDGRIVTIKYESSELKNIIQAVDRKWNARASQTPLEFSFYREDIMAQYKQEEQAASLFSIFAMFSILIAIIGLVGLVSYSAEQRKKEIGIRKVFGASLSRIYVMINAQYAKLLLLAILIATPFTWWLMQKWLDGFPYRVSISPWVFVFSGLCEVVLAMLCVGYLALRAATTNPSTVLRDE